MAMKLNFGPEFARNTQVIAEAARTHPCVVAAAFGCDASTQKELRAFLRNYPLAEQTVDQSVREALKLRQIRAANHRIKSRGIHSAWSAAAEQRGLRKRWGRGLPACESMQQRLIDFKGAKFWEVLPKTGYRIAMHVDARRVHFGRGIGVAVASELDWDGYSRATPYPMRRYAYDFSVPSDWGIRVYGRGLAVLDGLLTLDAVLLDARVRGDVSAEPIRIYSAAWIVQGRGLDLRAETGFIAVAGAFAYHSIKSPEHAARGIIRKIRAAERGPVPKRPWKIDIVLGRESLDELVAKAVTADPDLVVAFADATSVGACTPGIMSWCVAVGLDPADGSAPIERVLAAYHAVPAPEARGAILHAIRSSVAARRALVAASPKDSVAV